MTVKSTHKCSQCIMGGWYHCPRDVLTQDSLLPFHEHSLSFREEDCFSRSQRVGWIRMRGIDFVSSHLWIRVVSVLFKIDPFLYIYIVCAYACEYHSKRVKDRLHVWESVAFLLPRGSTEWTQVSELDLYQWVTSLVPFLPFLNWLTLPAWRE